MAITSPIYMDKLTPAQREFLRSLAPDPKNFELVSEKFSTGKPKRKAIKTEVNSINQGQKLLI